MSFNGIYADLTNAIKCQDDGDCPINGKCPTGDILMKNICVCVDNLVPVMQNETCLESSDNVHRPEEKASSGVIRLPTQFGSGFHQNPAYTALLNDSDVHEEGDYISNQQATQNALADDTINQNTLSTSDISIKILIPFAGTVLLSALLIVVIIRRFGWCRKSPRGKNTAVIKASEGVHLLDKINVVNKNPNYLMSITNTYKKTAGVVNIPVEHIKLMEVVGEGAFGQVYKGELESPDSQEKRDVAVKVLKEGVSNEAREDFEREVDIMSAFDHDNILKLLGTVQTGNSDTPYMVFEYMKHGDLAELLRKNDHSVPQTEETLQLQKIDLIDITVQISNGMQYLTSQHFVHRDLATRNCLVGEGLTLKISDFGMSRDIYTCDYYRIGGSRMLPVRWMSPEAVKWGKFTTESDIWAFGVVLWEIFSFGRQPYYGHTNEEVIRFLEENILLQRPEECPSIVYHVMLQCWKADPKERLAFSRINKYLTEYHKQLQRNTCNSSFDLVNEYEIPL
ncbi:NTRK2-like protein [Mya arenaria]|uniref:Tyrosine-protein kinase receptor n=1 Tax=Mya arenaria TaxID=6604 RepID=A0ABY7EN52_MYAAR|nr:BDNF/NT-3 growth factors receptor-like isoform X2 [Mya arenaria]WAR10630.1 NTRK2-like protein [Mya arenaria]